MGIAEKFKLGVKNVSSKVGEEADVLGISGKISSEKKKIEKLYQEIGEYVYKHKEELKADKNEILKEQFGKVDESLKAISEYEAQVKDVKDKGHNEREENRKTYQ